MTERKAHYQLDDGETQAERAESLLEQLKDAQIELTDALEPLFDDEGSERQVNIKEARQAVRSLLTWAQELDEFVDRLESQA